MKKLLFLVVLLMVPFLVSAKDVEIKKVELVDKSAAVVELEPAKFNDLKLDFKLKFTKRDEFVKYKLVIRNNSDKDYEIDNSSTFNEGKFIKYEYQLDSNEKILKAKSEINMVVVITYVKDIDDDKFVNGKYSETNSVAIELSNESEDVIDNGVMRFTTNPETSTSDLIKIVVIIAIMSAILALIVKSKKGKVFIIIMMLMIPVMVLALEKIRIEVDTYVEIDRSRVFVIKTSICENENAGVFEYNYLDGMTFAEFKNTDNYRELDNEHKIVLDRSIEYNTLTPNSTKYSYYLPKEYDACISEIEWPDTSDEGYYDKYVAAENEERACYTQYKEQGPRLEDKIKNIDEGSYHYSSNEGCLM